MLAFREYFKEAFPGHSANTATHPGSPYSLSCFTFPLALITTSNQPTNSLVNYDMHICNVLKYSYVDIYYITIS